MTFNKKGPAEGRCALRRAAEVCSAHKSYESLPIWHSVAFATGTRNFGNFDSVCYHAGSKCYRTLGSGIPLQRLLPTLQKVGRICYQGVACNTLNPANAAEVWEQVDLAFVTEGGGVIIY